MCVKKPAACVRAGAESPANAANGLSGVAADHGKAWQLRLLIGLQRFAVLIGCELVFRQFVGENRQFNAGTIFQFSRNMK